MLPEFSTDILVKILSFLPLKDVLHLSCISSKFRDASAMVYARQRKQIYEQYSSRQSESSLSFKEVRRLLLSNYGFTVGLWKIVSTLYGGLLEVKFDGYQLVGTRFFPPSDPHIDDQLQRKKIFIININDEGKCECICLRGNVPHPADNVQFDCDGFHFDCCNSEIHELQEAFDHWLKEELGEFGYDTLLQEVSVKCRPLHLPRSQESVVIQPGLFKGNYSCHGIELVLLTYGDVDGPAAVVTKITGDPNVPAGNITIIADLNAPIAETQESSTESGVREDDPESREVSASGLPLQRFKLPGFSCDELAVPEFCEYKFSSNAQIASTGYEDPTFVKGQWIIFDGDTFGHVWLCMGAFAMFKRVTETFCI